ncbi:hypothetical protein BGW38_004599 [Lunasporangiospora selenospora]|uniref:Uncharacterized protein n=1 Tax=Lunasporangiospora selenospora TaxID=979761 RepID=A0A9P6G0E2_9FUNG|nr:hypothetical protein BGW38_004599 [Lunasporangiospora selenospora]
MAVGFSATLFVLGFSGLLLTGLFSTQPLFIDMFANNVVITVPIWNASYNAKALVSREDANNAASEFVRLLSSTQKLNLSAILTERDPEPTNFTALKIYTSVTTDGTGTTMLSDYFWMLAIRPVCQELVVKYQNTSSGAFRLNGGTCPAARYGADITARLSFGTSSSIYLTEDSWGQQAWEGNYVPTAKIQQREILTQANGSTLRVSETYSTFDSVATTTYDIAGIHSLCVSIMGVHRDEFDTGLCSNMTLEDRYSFQAMDVQYNKDDDAMMIRYCSVFSGRSTYLGSPVGYYVGCLDYILQLFSIQSTGIQDGSGKGDIFYPTAAGSDMLSIKSDGAMYNINITKEQNSVLQVNIASSTSIQKSVPNQAVGEWSTQVTDFSMIFTDTRGVPGAQKLYTSLLSKTLSDWQKPQVRAPVGQYRTTDSRPWIRTKVLLIAVEISVAILVLASCIERWYLSPYYKTTFMNNVRATTCAEMKLKKVIAEIWDSGKIGEPAYVTLNSLRLTLESSDDNVEKDFLISSEH